MAEVVERYLPQYVNGTHASQHRDSAISTVSEASGEWSERRVKRAASEASGLPTGISFFELGSGCVSSNLLNMGLGTSRVIYMLVV